MSNDFGLLKLALKPPFLKENKKRLIKHLCYERLSELGNIRED